MDVMWMLGLRVFFSITDLSGVTILGSGRRFKAVRTGMRIQSRWLVGNHGWYRTVFFAVDYVSKCIRRIDSDQSVCSLVIDSVRRIQKLM